MLTKNIIALFCIVCFIEKYSTSVTAAVIPTIDVKACLTDEWPQQFKKYVGNEDGLISAKELQRLIFEEFKGFVTIGQAGRFISLTNLDENDKIGLKEFKKMEPIMAILSKRENSEDNDEVGGKGTISTEVFRLSLWRDFQELFEEYEELHEILNLIGPNESDKIELKKFEEIEEMLDASIELNNLYKAFFAIDKNNDKVVDANDLIVKLRISHPTLANQENVLAAIQEYDTNNDNVIDFFEFLNVMRKSRNEEQKFLDIFGTSRITRKRLTPDNDYDPTKDSFFENPSNTDGWSTTSLSHKISEKQTSHQTTETLQYLIDNQLQLLPTSLQLQVNYPESVANSKTITDFLKDAK